MHIGSSETVKDRDLLGIFDIDAATVSADTRRFLSRMQGEYKAVNLAADLPSAFVVTTEAYTDRVYLTALSAGALKKRAVVTTKRGDKR